MNAHHRNRVSIDRIEQMFDNPADQMLLSKPRWDFPARLLVAMLVLALVVGIVSIWPR